VVVDCSWHGVVWFPGRFLHPIGGEARPNFSPKLVAVEDASEVEHRTGHRKRWTRGIERTLMVSLYQLYFIALAFVFQTVSSSNTRLPFSLMFCFGYMKCRLRSTGYADIQVRRHDGIGGSVRDTRKMLVAGKTSEY
jgi:hypothetical protein